jgi:thiol-disulfide isomerase/thioredoxin
MDGSAYLDILEHQEASESTQTMKTRNILSLLLLLFVISSCSEKAKVPELEKGTAIITGHINKLGENTRTIRFAAGTVAESIEHTVIIDSEGNFRAELELYHPQNLQGFFKGGFVQLFLGPSDSIHLEIDESKFIQESAPVFEISGTEPDAGISRAINQYLRFCGESSFDPDAEGKSVKEFLDDLQQEIIRQDSLLESFCQTANVTDEFKSWAKNDIRYGIANYLLVYKFSNQDYEGELYDLNLFPVNNDAAIVASYYPLHLRHYALNLGIWKDAVTQDLLERSNYAEAYKRCLSAVITEVEEGLSRDIMCYKLLQSLINESVDDYNKLSPDMDAYIANETLKTALAEKEGLLNQQKGFDISFLDPESEEEREITGDFWQLFNEKYQYKMVYMDIWATWCGPCRAEIPHAIELHEYFKGKDIAFVNLCLASKESDWQMMIKDNGIQGDNYYFNEAQTRLLRDKLKFRGYPTYMIIDRQGTIVNRSAPRPSSGDRIRNLLTQWIEESNP